MADPAREICADNNARSRSSVRLAAPLAASLARIVCKRPRAHALKRSVAAARTA